MSCAPERGEGSVERWQQRAVLKGGELARRQQRDF